MRGGGVLAVVMGYGEMVLEVWCSGTCWTFFLFFVLAPTASLLALFPSAFDERLVDERLVASPCRILPFAFDESLVSCVASLSTSVSPCDAS